MKICLNCNAPNRVEAQYCYNCHRPFTVTYNGHLSRVNCIALSPSGFHIASASDDKTVQIWEVATGRLILTYRGHAREVLVVAWSPDGTRIASGSQDQTVHVWEVPTGRLIASSYVNGGWGQVASIAWDKGGKILTLSSDLNSHANSDGSTPYAVWKILCYEVKQSDIRWRGYSYEEHKAPLGPVTWSPDGQTLASSSGDGEVHIWKALFSKRIFTYTGHYTGRLNMVNALAWSPDGAGIVSGSQDGEVHVWTAATLKHSPRRETGQLMFSYREHTDVVTSTAWSPDGRHIASGSHDKTVQVWSFLTKQCRSIYTGHSDKVTSITWLSFGTHIASASDDGTVQIWQAF